MQQKLLLFLVFLYAFAKTGTAQTSAFTAEDVTGVYLLGFKDALLGGGSDRKIQIKYTLTLSPDNTFEYHNFRQLESQPKENWYGKGTWTFKGKTVYFNSTSADIDKKYTLDFNNSKARFFKKSARSRSTKEQPTYIQFFDSEYKVAVGKKLFKNNE